MPLIKYHRECHVCGDKNLTPIIDLGERFLDGCFDYPDFHPPLRKVPAVLVRCDERYGGCGLVQLKHSIDSDILYSRYGYRSDTSHTMKYHLKTIVDEVVDLFEVKTKYHIGIQNCLDVGCNNGYLLKQYSPDFKKVGIDPSDVGGEIKDIENFRFINDSFPSPKLPVRFGVVGDPNKFDIVTMIACFYDVNDPVCVAENLSWHLKDDGILIVEVSYWPRKMEMNALDEIVLEHVCYYNYQNLEYIFKQAGLKIFDAKLNDINGGSIQIWLCHDNYSLYDSKEGKARILDIKFKEFDMKLDTMEPYQKFKENCMLLKSKINVLFDEIKRKGETVHILGASTKGNVLLEFLGLDSKDIPYASERSKEKVGGKTLSGIKMLSEEDSRRINPNYYFCLIWSFSTEVIKREIDYINQGGSIIFPLPKLLVINKDNLSNYI